MWRLRKGVLEPYPEFNNSKLEVSPRNKEAFNDKIILWRFQDKQGFLEPNAHIDYGHWINDNIGYNNTEIPSLNGSNVYWIYLTIGDPKTGQCVQHSARIKVSDSKILFTRE